MVWLALTLYASWTLLLVASIAALRCFYSLRRLHRPNGFSPAGDDVSAFSGRLCRAHANCYENLPVVIAVVVVAAGSGHLDVVEPLALPLVGARIAQSAIHLRSTSIRAVTWRFVFFVTQLAIVGYWLLRLFASLL